MATLTAARAVATHPVSGAAAKGILQVAYGTFNITAALSANDIIQFCRLPAGALVIGGYLIGADIDTGTEAFDFDIGWADNGTDGASSAGLLDSGVLTGAVIAQAKPEVGIYVPFNGVMFTTGFPTFTKETIIQGKCIAPANAGGTGILNVVVFYVVTSL